METNWKLLILSFYKVLKTLGVYSYRIFLIMTCGYFLALYTPLGIAFPESILLLFIGGIIWIISPITDLFFGVKP